MEEDRACKMMEMLRSGMNRLEEEWKLGETRMQEAFRSEKHRLNQIATGIFTEVERMLKDPSPTLDPKNMELCFSNKISQPILTGDEIKGDGIDCLQVVLRDSSTRNIVDIGPIASASVEIVVLGQGTDDWTGEEFNEKIVRVEGKPPLLTVDECKLQGGIGVLKNVKFRNHAIDVKPSKFRLGARIAEKFDGIIVKEAKTESFAIKSYRCKYTKKNEIPNLSDKIWVLKNIQRRGNIYKRLQAEEVDTVEKFLIQLLINHQKLKNIAGLGRKKWEAVVNHARKCESDKVYWYTNSQGNVGVVFDVFGKLQWLYSEGQFFAANMLSENKKVDADNLLSSGFENWKNVEPFDDLNSLQQHLAAARASFEPSNSCIPGIPDTNPDPGASEMIDESNNIEVPDPLFTQGGLLVSDMTSLARCDSFGTEDVEYINDFDPFGVGFEGHLSYHEYSGYDAVVVPCFKISRKRYRNTVVPGFKTSRNRYRNTVVPGFKTSRNRYRNTVVPGFKTSRKRNTLFRLSKWILFGKKFDAEARPARKKQKICKNTTF